MDACRFCLSGAALVATYGSCDYNKFMKKLDAAVTALFPRFRKRTGIISPTVVFNDADTTTFADIKKVLDHAQL